MFSRMEYSMLFISVLIIALALECHGHDGDHHRPVRPQFPHQFQIPQRPILINATFNSTLKHHHPGPNGGTIHSHPNGRQTHHHHPGPNGETTHSHPNGRQTHSHQNEAHSHPHVIDTDGHTHSHDASHRHSHIKQTTRSRHVISNLWNGSPDTISEATDKGGNQVIITLEDNPSLQSVVVYIDAPFYDDPIPPNGSPGEAYFKLWEYEVVEAFFLSSQSEKYLELEFGPHGQHLMLLLDGRRNAIKHSLSINYRSQINQKTKRWYGKAIVPLTYFPPQVDHMNAYAIHDQQNEPIYKSLYPSNGAQPDFHDLESFASLDDALPSLNDIKELSSTWKEALDDQIKSDDE